MQHFLPINTLLSNTTTTTANVEQFIMEFDRPLASQILNYLIQVTGLISALVFGISSVSSWTESVKSTQQAVQGNLLSMLTYCDQIRVVVSAPSIERGEDES